MLADKGFDPNLGARPLKRVIQQRVLNPLSLKIVAGIIKKGQRIIVDVENNQIAVEAPSEMNSLKKEKIKAAR